MGEDREEFFSASGGVRLMNHGPGFTELLDSIEVIDIIIQIWLTLRDIFFLPFVKLHLPSSAPTLIGGSERTKTIKLDFPAMPVDPSRTLSPVVLTRNRRLCLLADEGSMPQYLIVTYFYLSILSESH